MVPTMIGTEILKRGRASLFQGTKKFRMASLRGSLRDYPKYVSNNWVTRRREISESESKCRGDAGYQKSCYEPEILHFGEEGSNMKKLPRDPDMLEKYDLSKGVRGKYAQRYAEGTNVVVIEPDVAKIFPDHDSVNQALRSLAEIIKRQKKHA